MPEVALPEFMVPPESATPRVVEAARRAPDPAPLEPHPPVGEVESSPPRPAAPSEEHETVDTDADAEADIAERWTEEFLRSSPVLSAQAHAGPEAPAPRPLESASPPRENRSATAIAVASLAAEVDRLGVPAGHRARARATLLDLSRQLDAPDFSWESLREAVGFVMEFPGLGRRVLPLLLPYLDRAA
jgi:hypothetical protein